MSLDSKLHRWGLRRIAIIRKVLRKDRWLARDVSIGVGILFFTELVASFIRAALFMFYEEFWDYEFAREYVAQSIPSILILLMALLIFGTLCWGLFIKPPKKTSSQKLLTTDENSLAIAPPVDSRSLPITIKSSINALAERCGKYFTILLQLVLFLSGLLLVLVVSIGTSPLFVVELAFIFIGYISRFVAQTRLAGLIICAFCCAGLLVLTIFGAQHSTKTYSKLLRNVRLSDWSVEVSSFGSSTQPSTFGCLKLLGPNTIWLQQKSETAKEILAISRLTHNVRFISSPCLKTDS